MTIVAILTPPLSPLFILVSITFLVLLIPSLYPSVISTGTNTLMENKFLVYYEQACVRNRMNMMRTEHDKREKAAAAAVGGKGRGRGREERDGGSALVAVPGTAALLHNNPRKDGKDDGSNTESAYGTISLYQLLCLPELSVQEGDAEHSRKAALRRLQTSLALEGASDSQWTVSKLWWRPKGGEGNSWLYLRALAKSFWGTFAAPAPLYSETRQLREDVVNPHGSLPGSAGDKGEVVYVSAVGAVFLMAAVGGVMSYAALSYLDKRPTWR